MRMMSDGADERRGLIFNIQKFSIQDGPGIRTTLFMKGCPLSCPWCSNPEGMSSEPEIMVSERKCIGCKRCAEACSTGAISFDNGVRTIDWKLCTNCLECGKVCPSHAIQVMGEYKTVNEAFKIAAQDRDFYSTSGGGVTVSGGEPLLQWEFVRDLFKKCKDAGFHTALDTTAYCPWDRMEQVLKHTDLILFDIKHMNPEKHEGETGVSNELILENLDRASKATTTEIWLRIPLIPGFNDSESNVQKTAELASRTGVGKISLLPYHDWGRGKYSSLGKQYGHNGADGMLAPGGDVVQKCKMILESHGLEVTVGK
jgi:pyruvate formate lyase activating enzyme